MAKKTARTRSTAQRNRPKAQKSFELVRQTAIEKEAEVEDSPEPANSDVVTLTTTTATSVSEKDSKKTATVPAPKDESESTKAIATHNASASERLAARRQAAQKAQQRSSATLITAEHYSYVRKDLIYIAILALVMFAVLIGLHFVPSIGG
jgi:cobalamin biosynthesis Mg chelatase CobN